MAQIEKVWFDANRIYLLTDGGDTLSRPLEAFPVFLAFPSPFPLLLLLLGLYPALIHLLPHSLHCTLYKIFHSSELSTSFHKPISFSPWTSHNTEFSWTLLGLEINLKCVKESSLGSGK